MFRHIPAASWTPLSSNTYPFSSSSSADQQQIPSNEFSSSSFLGSNSSSGLQTGSSFLLSPLPLVNSFDSSSPFSSSSTFRSFIVPPVPSSFLLSADRSTDASASANRDFHTEGDVHRSIQHSSRTGPTTFLDDGKNQLGDIHRSSKLDGVYSFDDASFAFEADDSNQTKKAPVFGYHQNIEVVESTGSSLSVQDCPVYFDKYSSFFSALSSATLILDELKNLFNNIILPENQILDFDFGKSTATMKCQTFLHCAPLQFRVSVFKNTFLPNHPQQAKYIVEFQKREGCCIAFRHVYKLLREKMSAQLRCGDVATPVGNAVPPCVTTQMGDLSLNEKKSAAPQTQSSSSLAPPSLTPSSSFDSFSLTPRPKLDKDSARLLCEMASSNCIQSSREALRALCHASMVDHVAAAEAVTYSAEQFQNFFQMLSTILSECGNSTYSQDQELVRCCLLFIANLIEASSDSKESESDASKTAVDDIRSALFSSSSQLAGAQLVKLCVEYVNAFPHMFEDLLKMREIKRQSVRLLCALAQVRTLELKSLLLSDDINVLEQHANCEDVKMQQYIHNILVKIR